MTKNSKKKLNDINIYPIKVDEEDKKIELDLLDTKNIPITVPFLGVIIGRVKAGKSTLLSNITLSDRFMGDLFDIKIIISPSILNDVSSKPIKDEYDFVFTEYSDDLLDYIIDMINQDDTDNRYLLVLDDIVGSVKFTRGKVDKLSALMTRFRHISNADGKTGRLSIILTTQYYKYINSIIRTNCSWYAICGNFPSAELKKISEELDLFGGSPEKFLELYKESKNKSKYDLMFCSIQYMSVYRSFKDILWNEDNNTLSKSIDNTKSIIEEEEDPN